MISPFTLTDKFPQILAIGSVIYTILMMFIKTHWWSLLIPVDLIYTIYKNRPEVRSNQLGTVVSESIPIVSIENTLSKPQVLPTKVTMGISKKNSSDFTTKYKPSNVEINDTLKYTVQNLGI